MVDKVPMTQGGFVKLQEELRWRQQEERPRIIEAIAEARAHGDLSENAEYHAAKEAQSHNEGRISELEDLTARAEVIDLSKMSYREKREYVQTLLPLLMTMRRRTGLPHKILLDEAHYFLAGTDVSADPVIPVVASTTMLAQTGASIGDRLTCRALARR